MSSTMTEPENDVVSEEEIDAPIGTPVERTGDFVSIALQLLTDGLQPFVQGRLQRIYQKGWKRTARGSFKDHRHQTEGNSFTWDAHSLLTVMWDQWNTVFRHELGHAERSLVSELREFRNRWAHQEQMDFDDTYRVVDSVRRLLNAVAATNLKDVERLKNELLESYVAEQVNNQIQKTAFKNNKWWIVALYTLCCMVIAWQIMNSQLSSATGLISLVIVVFFYLIYQQFRMEPPLLFGPRECRRCGKIIYRRACPYCE